MKRWLFTLLFTLGLTASASAQIFIGPPPVDLSGFTVISGTPVDDQVAVWISATDLEGDVNFRWTGTALVIVGTISASNFSEPNSDSLVIGSGADAGTGDENVYAGSFVGDPSATGTNNVLIGSFVATGTLTSGSGNVIIGSNAAGNFTTGIANVGIGADVFGNLATGQGNILIGDSTSMDDVGGNARLAIGRSAQVLEDNQAVIGSGSGTFGYTSMFLGQGVTKVTPLAFSLNVAGGSGLNNAAADWTFGGGRGTGTAAGGDLVFSTAPPGGSGSVLNALVEAMRITDNGVVNVVSTLTEASNAVPNATDNLSFFSSTTSGQLAGVLSDETGSGFAVFATSPTLTTPNIGAATGTSLSLAQGTIIDPTLNLSSTVTWNDVADTFTAWQLNVTDTASAAGSLLVDLQVGGVTQFSVRKDGTLFALANFREVGTENLTVGTGSGAVLGSQNTAVGIDALASVAAGGLNNTAVGEDAGTLVTTGDNNTFFGSNAGDTVSTGGDNTAIGFDSGASGTFNVSVGSRAGQSLGSSASTNVILGANAGSSLSSGNSNILIGFSAGFAMVTSNENVAIGSNALSTATADSNIAIGFSAGLLIATGTRNTLIGTRAGGALNGADSDNTAVGYQALLVATAGPNTAVGSGAGDAISTGINNTLLGFNAGGALTTGGSNVAVGSGAGAAWDTANNSVAIGFNALALDTTGNNTAVGAIAGAALNTGLANTFIGRAAGTAVTSGQVNVYVGDAAGAASTSGSSNTAIGANAGDAWETGIENTAVGRGALGLYTGSQNVAIGAQTAQALTTGANGVFVGFRAGTSATTQANLTLIGSSAGSTLNAGLGANTFIGSQTGRLATSVGQTVLIGVEAGDGALTGTNNVFIGHRAGFVAGSLSSSVFIGFNAGLAATAGPNTFIGSNAGDAVTTGINNTFVGRSAGVTSVDGGFNILIGHGADVDTGARASSIGIGHEVVVTADRQAVIGSADADGFLTSMFLGQGVTRVSPTGFTLNATGGSGTDNAAADWTLAGGRGTGTGAGGRIIFQVAPAGSTGSSSNALVDRLILNEDRVEVRGDPGVSVGGFASGNFHVTDPSTAVNANAVITGHNSNGGNKQLWYIGSTSSSNDNIAIINRQVGNIAFLTSNTTRMTIGSAGAFTFAASASVTSTELLGWVGDETGTGALVFANTPTLVTPDIGVATGTSLALSATLLTSRSVEVSIVSKTTTAAEAYEVYTNTGDADGSTFTLLNDPTIGVQWTFIATAAQTMTITASAGESIEDNGATCGTSYTLTDGQSVTMIAATGGTGAQYHAVGGNGTCNP